jgi:NRAMP (natural resistance-associated macrophage protein)-like metal ion transporter
MAETEPKKLNTSIIKTKNYWQMLGPGLTTGAADDDPSGIATYTQAGAATGFMFAWTAILTFPLMAVVQEMCARIGVVTGRGLAGSIRNHFPRWVIYTIASMLFVANTLNIGADLALMGEVGVLLVPAVSAIIFILMFSVISVVLQIFTSYKDYAAYLKYLAFILLAYVLSAFSIRLPWGEIFRQTFVPHLVWNKDNLFLLTAIIGTTISPYLFFWQTSQEVEEQILEGKTSIKARAALTTEDDVKSMRVDVWSGMFVSNVVMFFIIVASAATLFGVSLTHTVTAATAAAALKPFAGSSATLLFAMGVIGTGMLAIPVLAGSSSYAISESFGWKEGLYRKFKQAHAFYGMIIVSMVLGIVINFFRIDAVKTLLYSAVINGIIAPFVLILILLLSASRKIMGDWVNTLSTNIIGGLIVVLMFLVSIAGIVSLF